jgi:hypothetical protein
MSPPERAPRRMRAADAVIGVCLLVTFSYLLQRLLGAQWVNVMCVALAAIPVVLTYLVIRLRISEGRARRRAAAGECLAYGYDRTGLAAGVACPECGTARSSG